MTQSIESMIEVLQAYQAGKKIEFTCDGFWSPCDEESGPAWNFDKFQYRIAPEQKKKVKLVAFIDSHGELRWIREELFWKVDLVRVPSEDKEILL